MERMAKAMVLGRPSVEGSRVRVTIEPGDARGYLREREFWVEYPGLQELEAVDEGLLILPALGTLLTVSYALGVPIEVGRVDAAYASAADQLADAFLGMYPSFRRQGFALRGERVATGQAPGQGAAMLFSGGVDSTSSLIEHRDVVQDLVTVWGADVPVADDVLWQQLYERVTGGELTRGRRLAVVQSNMKDVVDGLRLTRRFADDFHGYHWWGTVQHGLALTSLVIPLCAHDGRDTVYIASTGSPLAEPEPWGSSPAVDNLVRWSNGRVVHDQPDHTRQAKFGRVIAPYVRQGGRPTLAVCYQLGRGAGSQGLNCGRCEKCMRTVTGLLVERIDPHDVGVPMSIETLDLARRNLAGRAWVGTAEHEVMWTEMQVAVPTELHGIQTAPGVREYLEWFRDADLDLIAAGPSAFERARETAVYGASRMLRHLPLTVRKTLFRGFARWVLPPL